MVAGAAARIRPPREAIGSVTLVGAFTILPLLVLMVRQVRRGAWQTVDASRKAERRILYAVGGIVALALLAFLLLFHSESFLIRGTAGILAMLAVCALVTRWIKVSLHMTFAALATTTLILMGSRAGWFLLPLVPALAWSRLTLGKHTLAEVLLGLVIGAAAAAAIRFA
jgi:membrane-associated phospholipid phosphatase